ncbi:MAG: PilW family protein [Gammaproteobacteria bacterium]|nr:PilW family protein [Gammaproteobacteria bacterium]
MNSLVNKQAGLSLVELLVAMVISLFLMGGIVQVYVGNKSAYNFSDANARVQENGRFALDTMATDLRMAGFWGCASLQDDEDGDGDLSEENPQIQNHLNQASPNYEPEKHDFLAQPFVDATVNDGENGSDSITVFGARPGQTVFTGDLVSPGSGPLQVEANTFFEAGDIVLITNCFTADIFEISAVSPDGTSLSHSTVAPTDTPGNVNLNNPCPPAAHCLMDKNDRPYTPNNAAAYSLQTITYEVDLNDNNEPALFRTVNNRDPEELIEGIEQMQILFGVDNDADGTPNQYMTSDAVADLNQVTAVRIFLVVRSDADNVLDERQTYTLNGQDILANDQRLRQVFTTTIALRNKTG